ncbi:L-2-amino-thiazoline-4-carboxylic acid hydrolase [Vallitalea maricola]|uniref:L-2-amino-thiazoline-4-carboxylic acid hydrolase n=1 Tax=Vallitalea maricola TaxID=3074433 RepID=A0ACB5UR41_9FIRM|nr:L-2-amino-thiazoline-4-carboxylic acid hydrolase [Vallitalea sp. AN17-2]
MKKIMNEAKINNNELVNEVRAAIEHRATWMGLICEEAKKNGYDWEAIGRAAISKCGHFHGVKFNEKREDDSVGAFEKAFLTDLGQKLFEMEITQSTDEQLDVTFHYCALVNAWQKQGIDQETIITLCDMAMDGDRGIAAENGLDFELRETIAKGDGICKLCFKKQK